jgi:ribosomal protein S18 acetylase RimI-like enzyme
VNVSLRPLAPEEWDEFVEQGERDYVEQMVRYGNMERPAAEAKAARDMSLTLPQGLETPGHWMFVIELDGRRIGSLWFAERVMDGRTTAYLYSIDIDESQRGHGYGREAMVAFEHEAAKRGLRVITLNVFGGNDVARRLYRSLGYGEDSVQMTKVIP